MATTLPEIHELIEAHISESELETALSSSSDLLQLLWRKVELVDKFSEVIRIGRERKVPKTLCEGFKERAKKSFVDKNYDVSLQLYSKLIEMCWECEEDAEELIYQGFCNRSATLFRMSAYEECLQDIEAAIHHSRGNQADYLLLERKARCWAALGCIAEASDSFQAALALAELSDLLPQMVQALRKQVNQAMQSLSTERKDDSSPPQTSLFIDKLLHTERKTEICYEPQCGRHIRAIRDIEPGEVVIFEKSILSFTQCDVHSLSSKCCHHCMKPWGRVVYPSPKVRGVNFCSWSCQEKALRSYHQYETFMLTDYIHQLDSSIAGMSGAMFLAYRAVVHRPWSFYRSKVIQDMARQPNHQFNHTLEESAAIGSVKDTEFQFLCSLLDHENEIDPSERLRIGIRAAILAKSLVFIGYVPQSNDHAEAGPGDDEADNLEFLAELLYRFQLSIAYNIHSVYRVGGPVSGDIPLDQVGSAVYQEAVYLNHSCSPNTLRFFLDQRIILVAKRLIRRGEEVTNNYGVHHEQLPRERRREILQDNYKFDCECEACSQDFPLLSHTPSSLPKGSLGKQLEKLLHAYQRSFQAHDLDSARNHCEYYVKKLHQANVKWPHKHYSIGAIALNSCWWASIAQAQHQLR